MIRHLRRYWDFLRKTESGPASVTLGIVLLVPGLLVTAIGIHVGSETTVHLGQFLCAIVIVHLLYDTFLRATLTREAFDVGRSSTSSAFWGLRHIAHGGPDVVAPWQQLARDAELQLKNELKTSDLIVFGRAYSSSFAVNHRQELIDRLRNGRKTIVCSINPQAVTSNTFGTDSTAILRRLEDLNRSLGELEEIADNHAKFSRVLYDHRLPYSFTITDEGIWLKPNRLTRKPQASVPVFCFAKGSPLHQYFLQDIRSFFGNGF